MLTPSVSIRFPACRQAGWWHHRRKIKVSLFLSPVLTILTEKSGCHDAASDGLPKAIVMAMPQLFNIMN
jgi:hypothetical protein